ncbi:MAG: hypothetical protein ABSF95_00900 [Verrucomicrobiota bacterium]|jgi:uncharacterized protein involved in outer membrane biogenesis
MKKLIVRILIGVVVLVVIVMLAVHFFLDGAIKRGVETIGAKLMQVEVKLDSVSLSLLSGSGKVKGLVVGNPEGFRTPSAIGVGVAGLAIQPGSIFSHKVVVRSVTVEAPEITVEGSLHGSNLSKILDNLKASTGGEDKAAATPKAAKAGKKLQVDEFVVTGGKVHVSFAGLAGNSATLALPELRLKDLGAGPEGITPAELTRQVLSALLSRSIEVSSGAVADLRKQAAELGKDAERSAVDSVGKAAKGIGGLLKKSK